MEALVLVEGEFSDFDADGSDFDCPLAIAIGLVRALFGVIVDVPAAAFEQ